MMATCKECLHFEACRSVVRAHGRSFVAFEYYLGAHCPRFADKTKYVEQKHGRWMEADDGDGVVCSVCGVDFCHIYLETDRFNYCPNCGAKMDGETQSPPGSSSNSN